MQMHKKAVFWSFLIIFTTSFQKSMRELVPTNLRNLHSPMHYVMREQWVDSVFRKMSLDERLGQLFMIAAYSNKDEKHQQHIDSLVKFQKIGGLIFMQGGPERQINLINRYQKLAKTPLLMSIDGEWGLAMRLDSTLAYPYQMTLGAIQDNELIEEMGVQIAQQCQRVGIHINFAPVVDVNSNPENPVIGFRSFGENKYKVAEKGIAYMRGMQKSGILANAKHFPGHGDTETDSHLALPIINHDTARLNKIELYPFKRLIDAGVRSMMVAHIQIPAYDKRPNTPTTLSKAVVTDLLKDKMKFDGLIFTDALNMKGIADFYKPGEMDLLALQAGNDVLLFSGDVPTAIKIIKKAIRRDKIKLKDIEARIKKILRAKYDVGLNNFQPISKENLQKDLFQKKYKVLIEEIYQKSLTLVGTRDSLLPFKNIDLQNFASVSVGGDGKVFQEMLSNYTDFQHFNAMEGQYQTVLPILSEKKMVIVALLGLSRKKGKDNYGLKQEQIDFIKQLSAKTKVVLCVFGSPYILGTFPEIDNVICAYQDNETTQKMLPQAIFGAIPFEGKLPISVGKYKEGTGIEQLNIGRLQYGLPESVGMSSDTLAKLDTLINKAIKEGVFPGCQVVVARRGTVFLNKNYGFQSYENQLAVNNETVYDLASITKVASTLQAVMFLWENGKLDLNQKLSFYLPELEKSNKKHILIKDLLLHQAGLKAFLPYWEKTMENKKKYDQFYREVYTPEFPYQVANNLYSRAGIRDTLDNWNKISKIDEKGRDGYKYKYSDLSFYYLRNVAEKLLKQPIEDFTRQNIYLPLGANTMMFNPLKKIPINRISPTESDRYFRKQLVRGYVHDQGAALQGGVGGHAGLFGTANDLAKLGQMQLQNGYYGGTQFFKENTVKTFSSAPDSSNRRGLGWDKAPVGELYAYISGYASRESYGHSGFTGTVIWIDPTYDLVFVFLSNRINPSASNDKITKQHLRRKLQEIVYKAMARVQ